MSTKEDLLRSLTVKELRQLAKENRVPLVKEGLLGLWDVSASRKRDIIDVLLESPKITKNKILTILEPPPKPKKKRVKREVKLEEERIKEKITTEREITRKVITAKEVTLDTVLDEVKIFRKYVPKITGKRREKLYTQRLTGFLSRIFPDIETEQALGKGTRIDAMVGRVGIEAKCRPDINEIHRLYGQIDTYLQFLDNVIVVFFDTDSGTVNDFKKKLKRGGYSESVAVVNI